MKKYKFTASFKSISGHPDTYPLDEPFLEALRSGLPPCGGIALGIDRLVMVLAGERSLDTVLPFRAVDNTR